MSFRGDFKMPRHYPELEENKFHIYVARGTSSRLHGHDFLELSYIEQGSMAHTIGGETSTLHAGDYFIVDYGTMHEYHALTDVPLVVINFLFYPEFVDRSLSGCRSFEDVVNSYLVRFSYRTLNYVPTGKTLHDRSGSILDIAHRLTEEYREKKPGYIAYIRCLLVEMLIEAMREIGKSDRTDMQSDTVREIASYVRSHYGEKIKLSDMARQYSYSLPHLSKKFQQEMGMGFSDYLQRIRLEQSCRMLECSDKSIGEIAALCGYTDIKFFNRIFRESLKMSPREFKKLHR